MFELKNYAELSFLLKLLALSNFEREREREREIERDRAIINVVSGKREGATRDVM